MNTIQKRLKKDNIDFIRTIWCDNANVIRTKAFSSKKLDTFSKNGVGISFAQQAVPVMYDVPIIETGLGPVGEARLVPDWSTLQQLPYHLSHARVIGDMMLNGKPWSFCPRDFLKRMIKKVRKHGFEVKIGFENEFYLLHSTPEFNPVDRTLFASTTAMDISKNILDEIVTALTKQGLSIEQLHSEAGPGQFEISLDHGDPLQKVDQQIIFRETVKAVALIHEQYASFMPKPFKDSSGSGAHVHISLWKDSKNITSNSKDKRSVSTQASHFIAGILEHLPALMSITSPSTNSYKRIQPKTWSGAFQVWGKDNREAAIRVPTSPKSIGITNFEYKTLDNSANPYIAIGSIISAGLDGINKKSILPKPVNIDPGTLTSKKRKENKIKSLPISLGEAINQLKSNNVLQKAMGSDLYQSYLAVKKNEWNAMKDMNHEEEKNMLLNSY